MTVGCLRCKATPWGVYGVEKGLRMMLDYLEEQEREKKSADSKGR